MAGKNKLSSRTWLVDARTNEVASYETLLRGLSDKRTVRRLCQPANAREALTDIVAGAAAGIRVTLLDHSLTRSEVERLGLDTAAINREEPCAPRHVADDFPRWLAGAANPEFVLELFTSGSTGLPRRVTHTLETLSRAVRVSERHSVDVWALAYPATHVAGVQVALQAMANGNTMIDVTMLRGSDAVGAMVRYGVTHISATPTFYRLLAATQRQMPLVRGVSLGGEPVDASLLRALRGVFPNARFRNIYASTEAGTILEADGDQFAVPEALVTKVRIRDGRLFIHRSLLGEFSCSSLLNAEARAEAMDWYDTGDCVDVVSESPFRFRITGRLLEWVNVGGDKVDPREVEGVLRQHASVLDVAVSGEPNSVLGSLLRAEVVLSNRKITEAELRAFAGERLQPFKIPRIIRFVDALSSTSSGKALRR